MKFLLLFHVYSRSLYPRSKYELVRDICLVMETEPENFQTNKKLAVKNAKENLPSSTSFNDYRIVLHQVILLPDTEIPLGFNSSEE